MAHYVNKKDLKILSPKKELKPRIFQLNDQQTLYFGGLARFDYVSGERSPFICYMPNELMIHRTKLENADALYEKHAGEFLTPPGKDEMDEFGIGRPYVYDKRQKDRYCFLWVRLGYCP